MKENNILIIAEKPSVANRIANALGKGSEKKLAGDGGIGYYEIDTSSGKTFVAAAVGHLFTIKQSKGGRGYPVLDIEWAPSYKVDKKSIHTKAYLDLLVEIGKKCSKVVNACDFDIEGTVIGTNIIKFIGKVGPEASRMKFSTTTNEDLTEAYKHTMPLDMNNFYAGEARHMLDWLWGINLSRALTYAVGGQYSRQSLSIGRVQGPSLALLSKRELEISKFIPKPFWRIVATANGVEFANTKGDMFDKAVADSSLDETRRNANSGTISEVEAREQALTPYPPFDLTSLQVEASGALGIDPSMTLSIAQSLYEKAYISYPRTSSQKLPSTLGLPKIIQAISKNPQYSKLAQELISKKSFKPHEGQKQDEAHPAIYPTGELPGALSPAEAKLYDMITRRFLSCFADPALVLREKVVAKFGNESYAATGSRISKSGWLAFYTYAKIDERMLPRFEKGASIKATKVDKKSMMTQPPKRYSKAGLISELEKRNLGTKATRAQIIDTLYRRKYLDGASIKVTAFGLSVYETLSKNCSMIVEESTTTKLEEDMEKIAKNEIKEEEVIAEGKDMLLKALEQFDKNKEEISMAMKQSLRQVNILGKCVKDGGDLVILRSRFGKQFVACANYPNCKNTYSLPQNALIEPTGKICEHCKTPIIKVIRRGKRPFEMDLDSSCITKKDWKSNIEAREKAAEAARAARQPEASLTPQPAAKSLQSKAHSVAPKQKRERKASREIKVDPVKEVDKEAKKEINKEINKEIKKEAKKAAARKPKKK